MSHTLDTLTRPGEARSPSRRIPAWMVPLAIATGFLLIFFALFRDRLLPARTFDVAVVLATPSSTNTGQAKPSAPASGKMLFQASGWIEPDPLPTKATALIDGVVASVNVLEGQTVEKGQLLATLDDSEALLKLKAAQQQHRMQISSHAAHLGAIATVRQKLASQKAAVDSAQAEEDQASDQFHRVDKLPEGAVSRGDVTAAKLRLDRERAQTIMAKAGAEEIAADIARLDLETTVKGDLIAAAAVEVEKAKLELDRTRILAPIPGRILRLLAAPGQKRMLAMDEMDSSSIAILYDPQKLQVRVDVPLADAAGLQIGQPVRIRCGLLPDREFHGEVTRITGEADLQRNTLQAKVKILDPVDSLRPEMLCRVEFLSGAAGIAENSSPSSQGSDSLTTWVPESAVQSGMVWICDPQAKRVAQRPVQLSDETRDGYRQITESLRPGEWVVVNPQGLREGQRIHPNLVQP